MTILRREPVAFPVRGSDTAEAFSNAFAPCFAFHLVRFPAGFLSFSARCQPCGHFNICCTVAVSCRESFLPLSYVHDHLTRGGSLVVSYVDTIQLLPCFWLSPSSWCLQGEKEGAGQMHLPQWKVKAFGSTFCCAMSRMQSDRCRSQ